VVGGEEDLLVERFHRCDVLLVDPERVVGLAEGELDSELAEVRHVVRTRLSLRKPHHVVVNGGERLRLKMVPEAFGVGDDALVQEALSIRLRLYPAGGDPHLLVRGKEIEEWTEHELRLEGLA
jgi:hypothetical protein